MASDLDELRQIFGNMSADHSSQLFAGYVDKVNNDTTVHAQLAVILPSKGTPLEGASELASGKPLTLTRRLMEAICQLTIGRYGWYKVPERSKALSVMLSGRAQLKAPTSFRPDWYKNFREQHKGTRGVFARGWVTAVNLPNGSTEISSDPAWSCLRALTLCLSCFCNENGTVAVLEKLIPDCLLHYDMEDDKVVFEGPFLMSLREWVAAVLSEEASNGTKDLLLNSAFELVDQLQTGSGLSDLLTQYYQNEDEEDWNEELQLIFGILKWAVTPDYARPAPVESRYPTRSLRAWTAASMLSQVGFEKITAGSQIITSQKEYEEAIKENEFKEPRYDVFLIATNFVSVQTDYLANVTIFAPDDTPPPEPTLVENIPVLAFRHVEYMHGDHGIDARELREDFLFAYKKAADSFERIHITGGREFKVKLQVKQEARAIAGEDRIRALFGIFAPHIHAICLGPFVEAICNGNALKSDDWDLLSHSHELFSNALNLEMGPESWVPNFYRVLAIMLGAMYGVCSRVCRDQGRELGLTSGIAFDYKGLYRNDGQTIKRWAIRMGQALQGTLSYVEWASLLFEMFVGFKPVESPAEKKEQLVLGVQSNGFTALSDILVRL